MKTVTKQLSDENEIVSKIVLKKKEENLYTISIFFSKLLYC